MIRIVANVSKKIPIPELDFSSQSYMAGLEVEVPEGVTESQILERIGQVYRLLEQSIDAQIAARTGVKAFDQLDKTRPGGNGHDSPASSRLIPSGTPRTLSRFTSGGQGGNDPSATQAQVKAIYAICDSRGLSRDMLTCLLNGRYRCTMPERLSVKEASNLIEHLKTLRRGNRQPERER